MKKFLLSLAKSAAIDVIDAAVSIAVAKLREDVQKSKFLNDTEKDATLRGADLLSIRVKEEVAKQLNG